MLKTLGLSALAVFCVSSSALAGSDVLLEKKDIKNLVVQSVNYGQRGNSYELSVGYTTGGKIVSSTIGCNTLSACTTMKSEIEKALQGKHKLSLHFDSDRVVATIVSEAPSADANIAKAAPENVCSESDLELAWKRKIAINLELKEDLRIEANQDRIYIGNGCSIIMKETYAQPVLLKKRSFSGVISYPTDECLAPDNKYFVSRYQHPKGNGYTAHSLECRSVPGATSGSRRRMVFASVDTALDTAIKKIECMEVGSESNNKVGKTALELFPDALNGEFLRKRLEDPSEWSRTFITTDIGKSEACTSKLKEVKLGNATNFDSALAVLKKDVKSGSEAEEALLKQIAGGSPESSNASRKPGFDSKIAL